MKFKLALLASIATGVFAATATAQEVLYVAGNGGSQEELMRAEIFPAFQEATGVEIVYVAGNSANVLARLLAQQNNQEIDVAMMNTGPMSQAIELGICGDLDIGAHEDNIYDYAKFSSGKAVGFGSVALGLAYNTETFAENEWDAPTSWTELQDEKHKGRIVFQPLNNTNGLLALIKIAQINGGGVDNMDPGFAVMEENIAPNVLSFEPSSARLAEMFQSGEVDLSVWSSTQVKVLAETGFPIELAYPQEGAMVISNDVCAIAKDEPNPAAQEFINFLISPEIQETLAKNLGFSPTNKLAELTEEEAVGIPYGEEQVSLLENVDWDVVNQNREDWDRRWVREIER
ncbi:ABC transporter substrate-binding protein [Pelagibacterium sediminicola]|uniref:ABC transporter substrate-binding protein n=1 Tax=Pelagibacterium sediminicola TaxID=2248761 RepID=UPI000E319265|nr:ABC transporter substrate-binding protein [Pelagibacterium sediminicola]